MELPLDPKAVTPTKRKHRYVSSLKPRPGDVAELIVRRAIMTQPRVSSHMVRRTERDELVLVLGLDRFLEWMLVCSFGGTLGWVQVVECANVVMRCP
jgi:hypothetical protein